MKRPRLDTGKDIFSLLTSVFDDVSTPGKSADKGPSESVNIDGDTTIVHMIDTSREVSTCLPLISILSFVTQLYGYFMFSIAPIVGLFFIPGQTILVVLYFSIKFFLVGLWYLSLSNGFRFDYMESYLRVILLLLIYFVLPLVSIS